MAATPLVHEVVIELERQGDRRHRRSRFGTGGQDLRLERVL
jgi:hypothetical protein